MPKEIEINVQDLLRYLKKNILKLILIPLLTAALAFGFMTFFATPQYESQSMIYITSSGGGTVVQNMLSSLQAGSALTSDYKTLATSKPILEQVIRELNLDMTYEELKSKVTTENPDNTRILTIKVRDPKPRNAKRIVDKLTEVERNRIADVMDVERPNVIQWGDLQKEPVSPSPLKVAIITALGTLVLLIGFFMIRFIQKDNIISVEDIESALELRNLAEIPFVGNDSGKHSKILK